MTREETIEAIKVMQAYVDGKEIEELYANGDGYFYEKSPDWNWENCLIEYRIKEEPKPFDWRGKNIQWIKHESEDTGRKVASVNKKGLIVYDENAEDFVKFLWESLPKFTCWQWSEDNATWRKFE